MMHGAYNVKLTNLTSTEFHLIVIYTDLHRAVP